MSFFPLIVTIIAIILGTSIIDIEAGLLIGLLAALISLQWVSGKEFRQAHMFSIRVAYYRNIGSYGISDGIDHSSVSIRHWAEEYGLW